MKRKLLSLLCSPCCKADLTLRCTKSPTDELTASEEEDISFGILYCSNCFKEFPIINGIPRLCMRLLEEEIKELPRLKNMSYPVVRRQDREVSRIDYIKIERKVREIMELDSNGSDYLKARIENNIKFKVRDCEKQEKFVETLKLYYDKDIDVILDIGSGAGGLIKCFSEAFTPSISIALDYNLAWAEVSQLRNPDVQIIRGDAVNLPFKRGSIDLVLSQAMLEHIKEYDKVLEEIGSVTKKICFIAWNPNKFSLYDFGHLDAPVTIFPKAIAKCIAILWHKIRKTGRSTDSIISELERTFYISTTHVKNILKKCGRVYNVFTDFALFSIKSEYSYSMRKIRRYFQKYTLLTKLLCNLLVLLRIEPQCYYILKKDI